MRKAALLVMVFSLAFSAAAHPQQATIQRRYDWTYSDRSWTLTHGFSGVVYQFYATRPRTLDYSAYGIYTDDTRDDSQLASLVSALETLAAEAGLNVWEKLNLVVSFVQAIPYCAEEGEYPRYPIETLVDACGDCEDVAILAAALLKQMGYGAVLLAFLEEKHMAVGVRVLPPEGDDLTAYEWNGDDYYFVEPTSPGWAIGRIPDVYASEPVIVAPRTTIAASRR